MSLSRLEEAPKTEGSLWESALLVRSPGLNMGSPTTGLDWDRYWVKFSWVFHYLCAMCHP